MEIWNIIISVALPIIITGAVGIIGKLIFKVGDIIIDTAKAKKESSGVTKQLAQHQDEINTAKEIWNIVEEKYRITEKVEDLLVSKSQMFDQLLLQKIPYLTQENIDDLRQAIAGEFNKGKQAVITDESLKQSNVDLQNQNSQLINEKTNVVAENVLLKKQVEDLNNKLNIINSALSNANNVVVNAVTVDQQTANNILAQADVNGITTNTIQ
jgi:hypothetical protein